jgi:hypothetical protein
MFMERSMRGMGCAQISGAGLQQIFVTGMRSAACVAAREKVLRDQNMLTPLRPHSTTLPLLRSARRNATAAGRLAASPRRTVDSFCFASEFFSFARTLSREKSEMNEEVTDICPASETNVLPAKWDRTP